MSNVQKLKSLLVAVQNAEGEEKYSAMQALLAFAHSIDSRPSRYNHTFAFISRAGYSFGSVKASRVFHSEVMASIGITPTTGKQSDDTFLAGYGS